MPIRLFLLAAALGALAMGCGANEPYGFQPCTTQADCPSGQQCVEGKFETDAGCTSKGKTCYQTCTDVSTCAGFKKPMCAKLGCSGLSICDENPF